MPSGLDEDADIEEGPVLSPEELDISNDERVKEIDDGRYVVSSGGPVTDQQSDPAGELEAGQADSPASDEYKTEQNPAIDNDDPTPLESAPDAETDQPSASQSPSQSQPQQQSQSQPQQQSQSLDARSVHNWLSDDLQASKSDYAFDVTANFQGDVSQQRMVSNDVVTTFETLVMWYAQQVDRNTPVGQVLGILLMEANVPIRYPTKGLRSALQSTNLSADDTIADLLAEVKENQGLKL